MLNSISGEGSWCHHSALNAKKMPFIDTSIVRPVLRPSKLFSQYSHCDNLPLVTTSPDLPYLTDTTKVEYRHSNYFTSWDRNFKLICIKTSYLKFYKKKFKIISNRYFLTTVVGIKLIKYVFYFTKSKNSIRIFSQGSNRICINVKWLLLLWGQKIIKSQVNLVLAYALNLGVKVRYKIEKKNVHYNSELYGWLMNVWKFLSDCWKVKIFLSCAIFRTFLMI